MQQGVIGAATRRTWAWTSSWKQTGWRCGCHHTRQFRSSIAVSWRIMRALNVRGSVSSCLRGMPRSGRPGLAPSPFTPRRSLCQLRQRVDCETVSDMRAWQVDEFGEPQEALRLHDAPAPTAGPGESWCVCCGNSQLQRRRRRARSLPDGCATTPLHPGHGGARRGGERRKWCRAMDRKARGRHTERCVRRLRRAGRRTGRHGLRNAASIGIGRHAGGGRVFPVSPVVARPA